MRLVQDDLPEIIESNFNAQIEDVRHQTYLMSISEHGDTTKGDALEDVYGRFQRARQNLEMAGMLWKAVITKPSTFQPTALFKIG